MRCQASSVCAPLSLISGEGAGGVRLSLGWSDVGVKVGEGGWSGGAVAVPVTVGILECYVDLYVDFMRSII